MEKFYSKQFTDKEEGLMQLKEELRTFDLEVSKHSANKTARAAILLLHRALRDKVYSVYSLAAQLIRIFFSEFATDRYDHYLYHIATKLSKCNNTFSEYPPPKSQEAWNAFFQSC